MSYINRGVRICNRHVNRACKARVNGGDTLELCQTPLNSKEATDEQAPNRPGCHGVRADGGSPNFDPGGPGPDDARYQHERAGGDGPRCVERCGQAGDDPQEDEVDEEQEEVEHDRPLVIGDPARTRADEVTR